MKFHVDEKIFEENPELQIAVVVLNNIDNSVQKSEIQEKLNQEIKNIKKNTTIEDIKDIPEFKSWRQVYKSFGAKPKDYKCSIENLYRMILKGRNLEPVNPLVDIYNYVSLKHVVPVGGDDLDKVSSDISLTHAGGDEQFTQLGSNTPENPKLGEVIYRDDQKVLCRRWNWRECEDTKIEENTKNAVIFIESLDSDSETLLQSAKDELSQLVHDLLGGNVTSFTVDKHNSNARLSE